jgi:hypothetical protein
MRTFTVCGCVIVLLLAPALATPQEPAVTSARVTLVARPSPDQRVVIENLRDHAIVAWQIDLVDPDSPARTLLSGRWEQKIPNIGGPGFEVRAHSTATRDMQMAAGKAAAAIVRPTLVIFDDGYAEGTPEKLAAARTAWQQSDAEITEWLAVLDAMPRTSEHEARDYLHRHWVARAASIDESGARQRVSSVVTNSPPRPVIETVDRDLRPSLEARLATVRRFLQRPATSVPADTGTSVRVVAMPSPSAGFALRVENLSDTPIEAWYASWTLSSTRSGGGQGIDCGGAVAAGRSGMPCPIPRHGAVEEPFNERLPGGAQPPVVKLTHIIFENGSFEGSRAEVDGVFKRREETADNNAYWIRILDEALKKPVEDARPFLEAAVVDRSRELAAANRRHYGERMDDVLATLARTPDLFPQVVQFKLALLKEENQRLLRHKPLKH